MARKTSFERRLLRALLVFSIVPSLLLIGVGTYLLSTSVSLSASAGAWERVAESARNLFEAAEASGDSTIITAATRHREELSASLVQAGRWEYLNERALDAIPIIAILLAIFLIWLAIRSARGLAREMAGPIQEMVEWSETIAREEPLPEPADQPRREPGEFQILRDAFRKMATELALSRSRALEAERARTWVAMARSVAHELKNPLTPMRLAIRTLQRGDADPLEREALEVMEVESRRLDELARSFAQFGHLPEGPTSEIDLRELFGYLLRAHLPESVPSRLRAPVDLPRIQGHHDALSRAFANLLLNAVDAMNGDGAITVVLAMRGDAAEIRVLDSGPGIPAEHLEQIWEPDFTTKSRGTGLGLALVRQTIQTHGGGIWAKNRPEGGAEFRILLPSPEK